MKDWDYKNFKPSEIACKQISKKGNCGCGGTLVHNRDAMTKLQKFRELIKRPFTPNSAYRCPIHNRNVGGAANSEHTKGTAFDIPIGNGIKRADIHKFAKDAGFTGFGDYNTFVHIDTGRKRYWDNRT